MKYTLKPAILPWLTIGLGGIGIALRRWLFATGVDEKGLLIASHPANILIWVLTAAAVVLLALCLRFRLPGGKYPKMFPRSVAAMIGCCIGAVAILISSIREFSAWGTADYPSRLTLIAGIAAFVSLLFLGHCRMRGSHPNLLFRALVCIYFIVHLVSQYRTWSAEPQLQLYFFQVAASVLLMLWSYYRTAMDSDKHPLQRCLLTHQLGLFFCCMATVGSNHWFYLAMGAWTLLDSCTVVSIGKLWRQGQ